MAIVTHQGQEYSCSVALKGDDYIHLLNEDGDMTVAFDGITDFSKFSITGGSWKTPTPENECYVAVVKDDGTMGKGGHKCSDIPTKSGGAVPIEQGGTGATNRRNAYLGLAFVGNNPVTTVENDTPPKWSELGPGYARFSTANSINDQPSQYGILVNYVYSQDVVQIWHSLSTSKKMCIRAGNNSGWFTSWATVYDTLNKPTASDVGIVYSASQPTGKTGMIWLKPV